MTIFAVNMAKKERNEIISRNQAFLIYQDDNGIARVNVRFEGEDVWLTQEQMMDLFDASRQDVSYHINQIYADGEQDPERTLKKFLIVRQEGNRSVRRNMLHYNLDMIIAVGYRVKSQVATRFRQWATAHLREFIQKGFVLDDNRLKGNRNRYFRELLQRIRDIRSSERNLYQQVTDLNLLVSQYLDFAEIQALQQVPMKMVEWIEKLDDLMKLSGRQLLVGKGAITHEQAKQKAIAEFEKYRKMEMLQYESDYDRAIKELIQKENSLPKAGANKESEEP